MSRASAQTHRFTAAELRTIHHRVKAAASVARLPLRSGRWSGVAGSVLGHGTGNSIDFQDQRSYMPGDDPRHINWQAYARTGHYTMKLYRQEVTPRVELIFDVTPSMWLDAPKSERAWELLYFCLESSLRLGAAVKLHQLTQQGVSEVPLERALAYDWDIPTGAPSEADRSVHLALSRTALRAGSLRIFLSDLLYEEPPEGIATTLVQNRGRVLVIAPFSPAESNPAWVGNIEFENCETLGHDKRRVEADVLSRYLRAYELHFSLWQEECTRRGFGMARVSSEGELLAALRAEALGSGVIEMQ